MSERNTQTEETNREIQVLETIKEGKTVFSRKGQK